MPLSLSLSGALSLSPSLSHLIYAHSVTLNLRSFCDSQTGVSRFFIYDTDRDNKLSKTELSPFLKELGNQKDARGTTDADTLIAAFDASNGSSDTLSLEEFVRWAHQRDSVGSS